MKAPNENGVYEPELVEEVARFNKAFAAIAIVQCLDSYYRYSIYLTYSYGGFGSPITDRSLGFETLSEAKMGAIQYFLDRFPKYHPNEPASVETELRALKTQIKNRLRQPTLF